MAMASAMDVSISIHAPREECDPRLRPPARGGWLFQSTHPVRGATGTCEM